MREISRNLISLARQTIQLKLEPRSRNNILNVNSALDREMQKQLLRKTTPI